MHRRLTPEKEPLHPLCARLSAVHSRSGRRTEEKNVPMPRIKPQYATRPTCSLVSILVELPRLV
jgi:hypothetical protein